MGKPRDYWRRTRRLTGLLLGVWLLLVLLASYFARDIDFGFFGGHFSFWLGAQGSLLVFLAIVVVYVLAMERLEAEEPEQEPEREPEQEPDAPPPAEPPRPR